MTASKNKRNVAAKTSTVYVVAWIADGERRARMFSTRARAAGYLAEYRDLMLRYGDMTAGIADGPRMYKATLDELRGDMPR